MTYSITAAQTVSESAGTVSFTVTRLDAATAETLFVSTSPAFGFSNNNDYSGLLNQQLIFAAGELAKTVTISITDDTAAEANETFGVIVQRLASDPYNIFLASSSFTITDNDVAGYALSPAQTIGETAGSVTFTITRTSAGSAETLYVSTSPTLGSANTGDYSGLLDQPLSFAAGELSRTVTISITDDAIAEGAETFGIIVQRATSDPATVFLASSSFTIADNDPPVSFKPVSLAAYPVSGVINIGQGNRDNDDSHAPGAARQWAYDFLAPFKSEVHAVTNGVVVAIRQDITASVRGYGNIVTIKSDDGYYVTYAHLSANSPALKVGDRVTAGDIIARSGDSGTYDGISLHPHTHVQFGTAVSNLNAIFSDPSTATLIADGSGDAVAPAYFPKLVIDFLNRADPGLSTDTDYLGAQGIDDFRGNNAANSVNTAAGDDLLQGNGGADRLDGGEGRDTAIYSEKTYSVKVTLNGANPATVMVGGVAEDTILNIENVIGGPRADQLTGDSFDNQLSGRAGSDTLSGAGGNDSLSGETGNDILRGGTGTDILLGGDGLDQLTGDAGQDSMTGGAGADRFSYVSRTDLGDIITDFISGTDSFGFKAAAFGFGASVAISSKAFALQADHLASTTSVRFIFDTSDTSLWYDPDGSGTAAAVLVADLQTGATVSYSDIIII